MKLSTILPLTLLSNIAVCGNSFSLSMNSSSGGRSKLTQQYKNIMSIHNNNIRMMPPPGEPEPEVRYCIFLILSYVFLCVSCVCVVILFLVDDKGRSREIYLMVYQQGAPLLTHKIICWCYTLRRRGRYRRIKNSVVCFIFGDLFLCMQFYSMGLWIVSMENSNSSLLERLDVMLDFVLGCLFIVLLWLQLVDIDTYVLIYLWTFSFWPDIYVRLTLPSRISSTSLQHRTKTITKQTHKSDETNKQSK